MPDICHICEDNPSYDDCTVCGDPTCRSCGKIVGDNFVCRQCKDKFLEDEDVSGDDEDD